MESLKSMDALEASFDYSVWLCRASPSNSIHNCAPTFRFGLFHRDDWMRLISRCIGKRWRAIWRCADHIFVFCNPCTRKLKERLGNYRKYFGLSLVAMAPTRKTQPMFNYNYKKGCWVLSYLISSFPIFLYQPVISLLLSQTNPEFLLYLISSSFFFWSYNKY